MKDYFETLKTINITIKKPVYGTFVYIRDKYLKRAKETGKKLVIKSADITAVCSAEEWLKDAQKIEKVFLIPDKPMVLYGNHLSKFEKKEKKEEEKVSVLGSLFNLPEEHLLKIKEKLGK